MPLLYFLKISINLLTLIQAVSLFMLNYLLWIKGRFFYPSFLLNSKFEIAINKKYRKSYLSVVAPQKDITKSVLVSSHFAAFSRGILQEEHTWDHFNENLVRTFLWFVKKWFFSKNDSRTVCRIVWCFMPIHKTFVLFLGFGSLCVYLKTRLQVFTINNSIWFLTYPSID